MMPVSWANAICCTCLSTLKLACALDIASSTSHQTQLLRLLFSISVVTHYRIAQVTGCVRQPGATPIKGLLLMWNDTGTVLSCTQVYLMITGQHCLFLVFAVHFLRPLGS